jgi:hypothetical protein
MLRELHPIGDVRRQGVVAVVERLPRERAEGGRWRRDGGPRPGLPGLHGPGRHSCDAEGRRPLQAQSIPSFQATQVTTSKLLESPAGVHTAVLADRYHAYEPVEAQACWP